MRINRNNLNPLVNQNNEGFAGVTFGKAFSSRLYKRIVIAIVIVTLLSTPFSTSQSAWADNILTEVDVGLDPSEVAVNPETNKIYIANRGSDNVTVIDGVNHTTTTVATGEYPQDVAVNSETNKIYIANRRSDSVTVIDGASHTTTTIAVGVGPEAIAVNPETNTIYVTNQISNNVTVIDGASHTTTTVAVGAWPEAIAVNPETNKIYVANQDSNDVTIIDGANNTAVATIDTGDQPTAVAVNPETKTIYVANQGSDNVTVIDGASNTTKTTVAVGSYPRAIAVNPETNKIYVANQDSDDVTVIDGASNTPTTTVAVGEYAGAIVVNPETNKIYVANYVSDNVTVIDGTSNTTTVSTGNGPKVIAVNPETNKIYVANYVSNNVTVIDGLGNNGTISPQVASFDKKESAQLDVTTTMTWNGNTLMGITNGQTPLTLGTDYTVMDNTVTILKAYLAGQVVGTTNLTFTFSGRGTQTLAITVNDTTPHSTISPLIASFDKKESAQLDVTTTMTWNENTLTGITNGQTPLTLGTDYTVMDNTVTILKAYLAGQAVGTTSLTFTFSEGAKQTLAITVMDKTNSTISPLTGGFDKELSAWATVKVTMTLNGNTLTGITNGITPLTLSDYYVQGSEVGIRASYLVGQAVGTTNLTFTFSEGATQTLAITVVDNTWIQSVVTGDNPFAIAVNPETNKIYVANQASDNVTVIDGVSNTTTTVPVGYHPAAVAVNSETNKIYVANQDSENVTVIDGVNNTTTTVAAGDKPFAVAVNPVTNKIYVVNVQSTNVTVIDGASNTPTATVTVGSYPRAIAVNPETNKIYVANQDSDNVTVIDGENNTTATVAAGDSPYAVAVNPETNKIYVANYLSNNVTVIDGISNTPTTVDFAGRNPRAIEVNPDTNKIYVANSGTNAVTVIDGASNRTTRVATETGAPYAIAVNRETNKIYVTDTASMKVFILDGESNTVTSLYVGGRPTAVAVNPETNRTYVARSLADDVTVMPYESNSKIRPLIASFDRKESAQLDVTATMTLRGNTLTSIANGVTPLTLGTDYTVVGNTVTILKAYLAGQLVGTTNLTFTFNEGATQTLAITVSDTALSISPLMASFDKKKSAQLDVMTTMTLGGNTLTGIKNGITPLTLGTDYSVVGNTVTILKAYLASQLVGMTNLTFTFSGGGTQMLAISVGDTSMVDTGDAPTAVAVNPETNKIYVVNEFSDNVTVIDGVDNTATTVAAGDRPRAIAVNSETNKIYVANADSNNVTVIDGVDNTTTTIAAGDRPKAVAVNPETNKIYVANADSNNVTVIDGVDNTTTTVAAGNWPNAIAVNPETNTIYVANNRSNNVTVIDGVNNTTTTVAVGNWPNAVAVNPGTNTIYVSSDSNVTVIDGADNTTTTVAAGDRPNALAVNPETNKIYVANYNSGNVTVIDGVDNTTTTVAAGFGPIAIAVNSETNTIYVANADSNNVTIIGGASNTPTTVAVGDWPNALAVNPETNKIYVANFDSNNVTVIDGPSNSKIGPIIASFDKKESAQLDVTTTMTLNGNTLTSIANGITPLTLGTDYTVTGNTVTILKAYLASQLVGMTNLTFTFSEGAKQTLAITVDDTTNSKMSPLNANFDKKESAQLDVTTTMTWNGNTLVGIANDITPLTSGTEYTVVGNTVTILKAYLVKQPVDDKTNLTFTFSGGSTQTLTISVSDTTSPTLSTTSASFDKKVSDQADVTTTLTLYSSTLTSIKNGAATLTEGMDYTISDNIVTIKKEYLSVQSVGSMALTFTFGDASTQTLTISVSDTTSPALSTTSESFDKKVSDQADVTTTLTLYSSTLTSIKNGAAMLTEGTDYTISGNMVTIKKEYLSVQSVGSTALTFTFGDASTQTLTISVSDTTSPTLTTTSASFYKKVSDQADVTTTMTLYSSTLTSIKNGAATLTEGTDYTISGNIVTIKKEYLSVQSVGSTALTFTFGDTSTQLLTISVSDTTSPTLSTTSESFDKKVSDQADVTTTLTLYSSTLTSIMNGAATLTEGTDYTISGNMVTIKKEYLSVQSVGSTALTFTFSDASTQTLTISVGDTTSPTLSTTSASFYKKASDQADVTTTLTLYSSTLTSIENGAATLTEGTDYTISGNIVTIKKEYLSVQSVGSTALTFTFGDASTQTLAITVSDTAPTPTVPPTTPTPTSTTPTVPATTPTPAPSITPGPTSFYNEMVNIDVIHALVEKAKTAPAITFTDVPTDSPYAKAIALAAKLGIIKGNADGSFHGNATITRAEFATMLVRALGLTSENGSSFKDTKGHWAADAIATLKASGVINGYVDGTFKPEQSITRAEIVAMLSKVMNITLVKNAKFKDVSGNWAEAEIDTLSDMGIVKGAADGSFKPNANATRSESLVMILRMLNTSLGHSLDVE